MSSSPEFYVIEHTNNCNLHCKTCPNRLDTREKGFMTPERFKKVIDQILENDPNDTGKRIVLHGTGEPFLSPYLFENLDYLEQKGFTQIDFSSNGNLFTKDKADRIVKYKCLNFVKISLNSSRKEVMEAMNTGSNYERVIQNIKDLLKARDEAGSKMTILIQLMQSKQNEDETPEEVYKVIGRNDFQILHKRMNNFSGLVEENEFTYPGEIFWDGQCIFGDRATMIQWDGDIAGCCNDNTKLQIVGNIDQGLFSSGVKSRMEQRKHELCRRDFTNLPICKKCLGQ